MGQRMQQGALPQTLPQTLPQSLPQTLPLTLPQPRPLHCDECVAALASCARCSRHLNRPLSPTQADSR